MSSLSAAALLAVACTVCSVLCCGAPAHASRATMVNPSSGAWGLWAASVFLFGAGRWYISTRTQCFTQARPCAQRGLLHRSISPGRTGCDAHQATGAPATSELG